MKGKNNNLPLLLITDEEKELVRMIADGKAAKKIAKEKKINYNTFAFNLSIIRGKCGALNTPHLVAYFLRNKLID